MIYLII